MSASYPNLAEKYRYDSVTGPGDFLDAAKVAGWDPGPLPEGVVFNFSPVITQRLDGDAERFVENPGLAPSNSRFFMTTDGRSSACRVSVPAQRRWRRRRRTSFTWV